MLIFNECINVRLLLLTITSIAYSQRIVPNNTNFLTVFRYPPNIGQWHRIYPINNGFDNEFNVPKFAYDSLLTIVPIKSNPTQIASCKMTPKGEVLCSVEFQITNSDIQERALDAMKTFLYGSNDDKLILIADKLTVSSMIVIPIKYIQIDNSYVTNYFGYATLEDSIIYILDSAESFFIKFRLDSYKFIDSFKNDIFGLSLPIEIFWEGTEQSKDQIQIRWSDFQHSSLYNSLDGLARNQGKDMLIDKIVYVSRDDIKGLMLKSARLLTINAWIEHPARFYDSMFNHFLSILPPPIDTNTTDFTSHMWASTYNSKDIHPDNVENWQYRLYDMKQRDVSVTTDGNLESFDVFKTGFSTTEKDSLKDEHEIEFAQKGNLWIPKSVLVRQVNLNMFNSDDIFVSTFTYIQAKQGSQRGVLVFPDISYFEKLTSVQIDKPIIDDHCLSFKKDIIRLEKEINSLKLILPLYNSTDSWVLVWVYQIKSNTILLDRREELKNFIYFNIDHLEARHEYITAANRTYQIITKNSEKRYNHGLVYFGYYKWFEHEQWSMEVDYGTQLSLEGSIFNNGHGASSGADRHDWRFGINSRGRNTVKSSDGYQYRANDRHCGCDDGGNCGWPHKPCSGGLINSLTSLKVIGSKQSQKFDETGPEGSIGGQYVCTANIEKVQVWLKVKPYL